MAGTDNHVGGNENDLKNILIFGSNNRVDQGTDVLVLGKGITSKRSQTFIWSDAAIDPKLESAFYVNAQNGFAFNTNSPVVRMDIQGALKMKDHEVSPSFATMGQTWKGTMTMMKKGEKI